MKPPVPPHTDANDLIRSEPEPEPGGAKGSAQELKALYGDEGRLEGLKATLHSSVIWAVRIASLALLLLFLIRIFHLAGPTDWLWLDHDRIQKIDSILFSGFLGALVSRYINQAVPRNGDSPGK